MVVSFVALFVALGGASYAATQLPANSVGRAQLQNGSVGNWKLKSNAVGARKIINGSVGAKQVNSSQVQLRVSSACSTGAVASVGLSGTVTCTPTLPQRVRIEHRGGDARVERDAGGHAVACRRVVVPGAGVSARGDQRHDGCLAAS